MIIEPFRQPTDPEKVGSARRLTDVSKALLLFLLVCTVTIYIPVTLYVWQKTRSEESSQDARSVRAEERDAWRDLYTRALILRQQCQEASYERWYFNAYVEYGYDWLLLEDRCYLRKKNDPDATEWIEVPMKSVVPNTLSL